MEMSSCSPNIRPWEGPLPCPFEKESFTFESACFIPAMIDPSSMLGPDEAGFPPNRLAIHATGLLQAPWNMRQFVQGKGRPNKTKRTVWPILWMDELLHHL